ncbi:hypothetical protein Daus18300_010832 [Diaporthe australafricana]|uniref:Uncharacterized protein n=1 Tax=Diaporthe australafricana TaxID=127596 RepID=A0ABR3W920_9PEZI
MVPIVVDGKINPDLLAIARGAYWVQSRVLHIPDRFGPYSSGPPLLQAFEGQRLASIATEAIAPVVCATLMELMVWEVGWWFPLSLAAISVLFIISIYVEDVFFNKMRAPDYNWKALSKKMGIVQPRA